MPRFFKHLLFAALLAYLAQPAAAATVSQYRSEMVGGAPVSITVWAKDAGACRTSLNAAFSECHRLDRLLSAYRQGSEITAVNQFAGQRPVAVSPEVLRFFEWSRQISEKTQGAWDPTTATFVWQYGFGLGEYQVPSVLRMDQLKPLVDYRLILIDRDDRHILFKRAGVQVDLDDLYRSATLNRLPGILKSQGARAAMMRSRNHMAVLGTPEQGGEWIYPVPHPRDSKRLLTQIPFRRGKILNAWDRERVFVENGKAYHPFVEPRNGLPASYSQMAVLYLPERPKLDLPASSLLMMPAAQALTLAQSIQGAECLIVDSDGKAWLSSGWSSLVLAPAADPAPVK